MHSTASDGTDAPDRLPALARAVGLSAIALTDHDTTVGLPACQAACDAVGITFVPGIEVSADPGPCGTTGAGDDADGPDQPDARRGTLHILGLFVRHDDTRLADVAQRMRDARDQRNPHIVDRLRDLGIDISIDDVRDLAATQGASTVGRPHIAQVLVRKGAVSSVNDAFTSYLARGGAAFVRRDQLPPEQAIAAIHHAGGLAILAHPVQLLIRNPADLERFVRRLIDVGLDGLETVHSDHSPSDVQRFTALAQRFDLLTAGGSDYHGHRKSVALGQPAVSRDVFERLRDAAISRR